jgi:hypothetical protein
MSKNQWQVDVFTARDQQTPHTFYGASLLALRERVYATLVKDRPTYMRSGGAPYTKEKGPAGRGDIWTQPYMSASDQTAYEDFCKKHLHIQQGPEYEAIGFIDGTFQLAYVRKIARTDIENDANSMLRRGWVLLAVENNEESGVAYVLGHVEQDAF